jgi:hypothetical protein
MYEKPCFSTILRTAESGLTTEISRTIEDFKALKTSESIAAVSTLRFLGLRTGERRLFDMSNPLTGTIANTSIFSSQLTICS